MSNQKRGIITSLFMFISILATGLSLAGYFGRLNLYLEFASGYKLQLLLIALCSLFYFGLTRHKIAIVISLFCILLGRVINYKKRAFFGTRAFPCALRRRGVARLLTTYCVEK